MSAVRLVLVEVGYEQRAFWRNPAAALLTMLFSPCCCS